MQSRDARIAIIVALIGLVGVLGAAVINNWGQLFPPQPTVGVPTTLPSTSVPPTTAPPTVPTAGCGGTVVDGHCWYLGDENVSCSTVCETRGGYDVATQTYSGSNGSADQCRAILTALNLPIDNLFETTQGGIGCFVIQNTTGGYFGYWDSQLTVADATYTTPGRRRICACQR